MVINNFNLFIFVLAETKLLKRVWERKGPRAKWIVKPPALARGNGIKVSKDIATEIIDVNCYSSPPLY